MNCYRVIFTAVRWERDSNGDPVDNGQRFTTPGTQHVLATTDQEAGAFVEREQLTVENVDEVHIQQAAEIAKNVLVAEVISTPAVAAQLPPHDPQMSGLQP